MKIAVLGLVAVLAWSPAIGAQVWQGEWVRDEARRALDQEALHAEIQRVTSPMSMLVRGIARVFIRRHVRPRERFRIATENGLPVIYRDGEPVGQPVDGQTRAEDGDTRVTSRLEAPDQIRQEWRHEASHGTTTWVFHPSGEHLTVSIVAHEARLPSPLRYSTRYRRDDPR